MNLAASLIAIGTLTMLFGSMSSAEEPMITNTNEKKIVLSTPVTHSDWIVGHSDTCAWGPEGIRYILDTCKAAGWTKIYWRALDGGRALYKSSLVDPEVGFDKDSCWTPADPEDNKYVVSTVSPEKCAEIVAILKRLDYRDFDTLKYAVEYGHKIGLEVHAWISINEDDHGWGLISRFSKQHPQYRWVKRNGCVYHSQLSFAFPEVRKYKLGIIKEILDNYDVDGIFLDWIRTGDVRDNPQNDKEGVADYGYEKPLVEGFIKKYGIDPHTLPNGDDRWVRYRAEGQTEFMKSVHKLMKSHKRHVPLSVMVQHPWSFRGNYDKIDGSLRGLLCDVRTWAKEGLLDEAVVTGYYVDGGNVETATRWLQNEVGPKVNVWLFGWVPETPRGFMNSINSAESAGAKQILYWESDYIDARPQKKELSEAMRKYVEE